MSHGAYEWVLALLVSLLLGERSPGGTPCRTYTWILSYMWTSHGAYEWAILFFLFLGERSPGGTPCLTYTWDLSYIWIRQGAHEWVMALPFISIVFKFRGWKLGGTPCLTYEWLMCYMWMSQGVHEWVTALPLCLFLAPLASGLPHTPQGVCARRGLLVQLRPPSHSARGRLR